MCEFDSEYALWGMNEPYDNSKITPIGITDWRNIKKPFGIKDKDRLGHIYVIGKTGVGKTTLLENMAISDIEKGKGCAIIDPHGDIAEDILNYIPKDRINDVIYFNAGDVEFPIAFNPLQNIHHDYHHLVASGLVSTFKKIWIDSWGPRLEYILKFTLLTLLQYPEATLLDIQPLLTDGQFRNHVLSHVKNHHIISFWRNEFEKYSPTMRAEAIAPILNKMGLFLTCLPLKNIVGQKTKSFKIQTVLDEGKILIANLSKGIIGEDATTLLGSMLLTSIQLAALHRAKQESHNRKSFFLFIDEAHSFISLSMADILSEARKYGLSLFLAHQYIDQITDKIRSAIFGNVGTMISFRIGAEDAEYLAKEFHPVFDESDLINLPKYSMYIKLMIDGATSKPFSATTTPVRKWIKSNKREVLSASRKQYGQKVKDVDSKILSNRTINRVKSTEQDSLFK
jgi:hypothetical protein